MSMVAFASAGNWTTPEDNDEVLIVPCDAPTRYGASHWKSSAAAIALVHDVLRPYSSDPAHRDDIANDSK